MISARARLTWWFAATAVAVTIVLAVALLMARSSYIYRDLGQLAALEAEMGDRLIERAAAAPQRLTEANAGVKVLAAPLRRMLEASPHALIVLDTTGAAVFRSAAVAALSADEWGEVQGGLGVIPNEGPAGLLPVRGGLLLVARSVADTPEGLSRVVAGVFTAERLQVPREYSLAILLIAPIVILGAVWGAYQLLSRPFGELDRIADEVTAITDGTSLHRRLPMRESRGELNQLVATLNAMIARLETSFMALRRFTADASHELKTPLAVLRADVERAMSDGAVPTERAVALEEALHETARMADLVESLLTLARADEGRFDVVREPVEFGPLMRDVSETASILGEAAGVTVTTPFSADAVVLGDEQRLRQLFLNLVTNAIKYTQPGGQVDLGVGRHAEHVAFAVRDTGIGIAAADIPHVFDRFWRADRARSRAPGPGNHHGGFGLGLAISQWIVQAHGGTLTVSSRLGVGSLFTVTLPLAPQDVRAETGVAEGTGRR